MIPAVQLLAGSCLPPTLREGPRPSSTGASGKQAGKQVGHRQMQTVHQEGPAKSREPVRFLKTRQHQRIWKKAIGETNIKSKEEKQ